MTRVNPHSLSSFIGAVSPMFSEARISMSVFLAGLEPMFWMLTVSSGQPYLGSWRLPRNRLKKYVHVRMQEHLS